MGAILEGGKGWELDARGGGRCCKTPISIFYNSEKKTALDCSPIVPLVFDAQNRTPNTYTGLPVCCLTTARQPEGQ